MDSKTAERNGTTGQYAHSLEATCSRCGHTKGAHDAEAPYAQDDLTAGFLCAGFKKARAPRPAASRCTASGGIAGSYEAARVVRCSCGWSGAAEPRHDRKVAGEVVPGWTVRIPAHKAARR